MRVLAMCLAVFLVVVFSGCTGANKNYGSFVQNRAVENSFKSFQIPEGYNYYYNGRPNVPNAIVGIKEGYSLQESEFWHSVDLDEAQMREWWSLMRDYWFNSLGMSYERVASMGWVLTDPEGNEAGIMYARYSLVWANFVEPKVFSLSVPRARSERNFWSRDRDSD